MTAKMTEHQASKKRETPILVWIVVGGIVAASVNGVIFGSTNTPDWLLEYSRWIFGLIIVAFVLFGLALRSDSRIARSDSCCDGCAWLWAAMACSFGRMGTGQEVKQLKRI